VAYQVSVKVSPPLTWVSGLVTVTVFAPAAAKSADPIVTVNWIELTKVVA
jgi:hypothetical protein